MEKEIYTVNNYELDEEQKAVVNDTSQNLLVVASAGSGKSLTIIGKIRYLIEINNIKPEEILCISFTNDSCISLKNNINKNYNYNIEVYTFHKLALNILKKLNIKINIAPSDLLEYVIEEFFQSITDEFYTRLILKYLKIKSYKNLIEKYNSIKNTNKIKWLKELISKFIHLYKSGNYNINYLEKIFRKEKTNFINDNDIFIILCIKILYEYKKELDSQNQIDFDDMISLATNILKQSNIKLKYKYIFIDEFQDTSLLIYNLIKEIINKTNAKLIVVGDDFQSIYRFSGCDLSLFINFKKEIENSKILKIQTTYRNSQELNKVCNDFIKKNPSQIKKKIKTIKKLNKPIKIIYYKNQRNSFLKLLNYLNKIKQKEILILGRNNNELNKVINNDFNIYDTGILKYNKLQDLKLRFLTVHKSKGLEENNVIVLSLENDDWSFPNKKVDAKMLKYVLSKKENFIYSEERRLFYVALTRTKNNVYLLTNKDKPSIFVKEILKDSKKYIEIIDL